MAENDNNLVSSTQNGLITPSIVDELGELQSISPLTGLKILPNVNAYWYYFQSRFNYIKYYVSGTQILPEINSQSLLSKLHTYACPGEKGLQGLKGIPGEEGSPGPKEITHIPEIGTSPEIMIISNQIDVPLDTPISLRLFLNGVQQTDIRYDLNSGSITIDNDIGIADIEIFFGSDGFTATITRNEAWGAGWMYKLRQVGPTGLPGANGQSFLSIQDMYAEDITTNDVISSLRVMGKADLYYQRLETDSQTVGHLRPRTSASFTGTVRIKDPSITPKMLIPQYPYYMLIRCDNQGTIYATNDFSSLFSDFTPDENGYIWGKQIRYGGDYFRMRLCTSNDDVKEPQFLTGPIMACNAVCT